VTSLQTAPIPACQAPEDEQPRWIEAFNFRGHPLFLDCVEQARLLRGQQLSFFIREALAAYIQALPEAPEDLKKVARELVHATVARQRKRPATLPTRLAVANGNGITITPEVSPTFAAMHAAKAASAPASVEG
jgi:hypothetical protein